MGHRFKHFCFRPVPVITGLPVVLPEESESVLLGAAILGATASKYFNSIQVIYTHVVVINDNSMFS